MAARERRLHKFCEVNEMLGFTGRGNGALNRALRRHGIVPIALNSRVKRLSDEMVELLLARASGGNDVA
jgi:hypothetical protein